MKFLIVNSFHRDDKGDAALLHVLIDQLLSIDPKANIAISSMEDPRKYPTFYKGRNIGSFELQSSSHVHPAPLHLFFKIYIFFSLVIIGKSGGNFTWLLTKDLKKIYRECKSADLVVSVGGGYFITKHDLGSRMHLLFALQTLAICKQIGRKVVTAPVSVGPFRNGLEAKYTTWMLRNLDLILLREDISKKFFVDKHDVLPKNVKRAVDSGFAFAPNGSFDIREMVGAKKDDKVLILAVRNWTKTGHNFYEQAHADLIDHIAKKHPKIKPVFIPQCTFPDDVEDDDDRNVARQIMELSKTKKAVAIEDDLDYQKVKLSYEHADFVVGTRFHSMVFGLSYNVPGIAIEYEHKTRGIMRELGLEEWVIPIGTICSEKLISLFDKMIAERNAYKKNLMKIMPEYVKSADEVVGLFTEILKK
jgi:colanic acid/amylovoran biosynthesis protein